MNFKDELKKVLSDLIGTNYPPNDRGIAYLKLYDQYPDSTFEEIQEMLNEIYDKRGE